MILVSDVCSGFGGFREKSYIVYTGLFTYVSTIFSNECCQNEKLMTRSWSQYIVKTNWSRLSF